MTATLEHLITVRDQRTTGVMMYLRALIGLPNQDAPPYVGSRRMTDLYIPPDVLKDERRDAQDNGRTHREGVASLAAEEQGRFGRAEDTRQRVAWERERKTIEQAVILGRPGVGKTLLARMTVRALAEESLDELTMQQKGVQDVPIPVCVHLADVAKHGALEAAVCATLTSAYPKETDVHLLEAALQHLRAALFTDRCWLFLDAFDEVPAGAPLQAALEPLRNPRCHVVVTLRPYGYAPNTLPFGDVPHYELAPFTPRQRRQFIGNWFKDDADCRTHVLQLVQSNPQFGDLTRNALLLTLTCATAERHDLSPATRRVDLYRGSIRDMVRGVWKKNPRPDDDPDISLMVRVLRHIAWQLFRVNPVRTLFSDDAWIDAVVEAGTALRLQRDTGEVLNELRATGLLVSPASGQRMFLHRTFLEYLAAEHIAYQAAPLTHIEPFLWQPDQDGIHRWQPAAAEMLCFLTGCLPDPNPLLQRVRQRDEAQRDQFRTMLLLAGRMLADADETRLDDTLAHALTAEAFGLWGRWRLLSERALIPALTHRRGVQAVIGALHHPDHQVRQRAGYALQSLGTAHAVGALIACMQSHPDITVHCQATTALGSSGSWEAERALLSVLHDKTADVGVRQNAATALGATGSAEAVQALLSALRDSEADIRAAAVAALAASGSEQVIQAVIERMRSDASWVVRMAAVGALKNIGSEQAVGALLECLARDPHKYVRANAARALGTIGNERAVPGLIAHMQSDPEAGLRWVGAEALGMVGGRAAVEALVKQLRSDVHVEGRLTALEGLQAARLPGPEHVVDVLITCMYSDPAVKVRRQAARTLGSTRSARAVDALTIWMQGEVDHFARLAAVGSLIRIGSQQAVDVLSECMQHDAHAMVQALAAKGLGVVGNEGAVMALIERMQTPTEADGHAIDRQRVCYNAASALGRIGSEQAVDALMEQLQMATDVEMRRRAAEALGAIGSARAVQALLTRMQRDADFGVRWRATAALRTISSRTGRWIPMATFEW